MIIVSGAIVVDPEKVPRALELTRPLMAATRQEPGNLSYGFYAHLDDPGRYHLYEEWEDQAALDAHSASEHLATFFGAIGDLEISHVELYRHEVASSVRSM